MQSGPEAVARSGEVMAHGSRVQAGIDSTEEYAQVRGENVRNGLAVGRGDLFRRGLPGSGRLPGPHGVIGVLASLRATHMLRPGHKLVLSLAALADGVEGPEP